MSRFLNWVNMNQKSSNQILPTKLNPKHFLFFFHLTNVFISGWTKHTNTSASRFLNGKVDVISLKKAQVHTALTLELTIVNELYKKNDRF